MADDLAVDAVCEELSRCGWDVEPGLMREAIRRALAPLDRELATLRAERDELLAACEAVAEAFTPLMLLPGQREAVLAARAAVARVKGG